MNTTNPAKYDDGNQKTKDKQDQKEMQPNIREDTVVYATDFPTKPIGGPESNGSVSRVLGIRRVQESQPVIQDTVLYTVAIENGSNETTPQKKLNDTKAGLNHTFLQRSGEEIEIEGNEIT